MIDLIHSFFVWFVSHPEFPWIYFFLMLTASYIFSEVAEKRARAKHPGPFRWGYFMGCMGLACAPAALMSVAALVVVIAGSSPQNTITQMILQTAIRTAGVRNQVLFGEQGKPSSEADVINLWRNHWAVRIVQADSDRTFLTSDNPSMWFRADEGFGEVNLVLMPVTPYAYAVAFDRRVLDFRPGATTEADETWLTRFQVSHCVECIYTAERLSDEQLSIARQLFARKTNQPPTMDANHTWRMNLFRLPNFSFIVRKSLPLWL